MSEQQFWIPFSRTHTCGELRGPDASEEVRLMGWVAKVRDLGGVRFVDLRDRYGIVQLVFDAESDASAEATGLRMEDVVAVEGIVNKRPEEMVRDDMETGAIEISVKRLVVLNKSAVPPFTVADQVKANEDLRLRYRYLDLRRRPVADNISMRHRAALAARTYLDARGFLEIETPMLVRCTPEGARDYLVPSRLHRGSFYALPQSPQLYKQILMVSGFDRYFQLARCMRDEDLRSDRQPEHTQIDIEMSFVDERDVFELCEGLMAAVFKAGVGADLKTPFDVMSYAQAIRDYGSDKPDVRLGMPLVTLDECFEGTEFRVVRSALERGDTVRGFVVEDGSSLSRRDVESIEAEAKGHGAGGLIHLRRKEGRLAGPTAKILGEAAEAAIVGRTGMVDGALLLAIVGPDPAVSTMLGRLRLDVGRRLGLDRGTGYRFVWVNQFPLFEDDGAGGYQPCHHLFSMPYRDDIALLEKEPLKVRGHLYDLVCNGVELASGSIRIHNRELQERVMSVAGISKADAARRFGFLLEAFEYGAPPHGGIAPGLDRVVMIMAGAESIRDVIAFPKTQKATSLMDDAPSPVDSEQLEELGIDIRRND